MVLQKLATSLRQHDWGTALIEVLVVVLGIFIGLQVDDWNTARKDRIDEKQFSLNADGYDAYIQDGLKPWSEQLDLVHKLVDESLGIERHVLRKPG